MVIPRNRLDSTTKRQKGEAKIVQVLRLLKINNKAYNTSYSSHSSSYSVNINASARTVFRMINRFDIKSVHNHITPMFVWVL